MGFKDILNEKLIVIAYHLTTEQLLEARKNRNWEEYDKLEDIEKLQIQLEEFSIYEDILEDITEESFNRTLKEINSTRFE